MRALLASSMGCYLFLTAAAGAYIVVDGTQDFAGDLAKGRFAAAMAPGVFDPSALQVRGLFRPSTPTSDWLCGEVNGKNLYGAYVGFHRFAYNLTTRQFIVVGERSDPLRTFREPTGTAAVSSDDGESVRICLGL